MISKEDFKNFVDAKMRLFEQEEKHKKKPLAVIVRKWYVGVPFVFLPLLIVAAFLGFRLDFVIISSLVFLPLFLILYLVLLVMFPISKVLNVFPQTYQTFLTELGVKSSDNAFEKSFLVANGLPKLELKEKYSNAYAIQNANRKMIFQSFKGSKRSFCSFVRIERDRFFSGTTVLKSKTFFSSKEQNLKSIAVPPQDVFTKMVAFSNDEAESRRILDNLWEPLTNVLGVFKGFYQRIVLKDNYIFLFIYAGAVAVDDPRLINSFLDEKLRENMIEYLYTQVKNLNMALEKF